MIVNEDLIPYVLQSILSYLTNFTMSSHLLQQLCYHDRDSRRRPWSTLFFRDKVEYRALTRRWLRDAGHTQRVSHTLCTRDVKEAWSSSTSIRGATDRDILRKHNARPRIDLAGMLHSHYSRFRSLCHALHAPPREIFPLCLFFSWLFARISHGKIVNPETSLTSGGQRIVKRSAKGVTCHDETCRSSIGCGDYNRLRRGWNPLTHRQQEMLLLCLLVEHDLCSSFWVALMKQQG